MVEASEDQPQRNTRFQKIAGFVVDSLPTRAQDQAEKTAIFPWYTPSRVRVEAGETQFFPEIVEDKALIRLYKRSQLAKVIVDDVPEDAIRNGFKVNPVDETTNAEEFDIKFQKIYQTFIFKPFLKGVKLCRLFGHSFLYIGYKEGEKPPLEGPPLAVSEGRVPPIGYLLPLGKTKAEIEVTDALPAGIKHVKISFVENEPLEVHPSRVIHLENEGLDYDLEGRSVLEPVFDLLNIQKSSDWSLGQSLFRGAAGLLVITAGKGATAENAADALAATEDMHTKAHLVLPDTWDAKDAAGSKKVSDLVSPYETIVRQIAAGARIPISELLSKGTFVMDMNYEAYLYSYQQLFIGPALKKIFRKFQATGALPEGDFNIMWKPPTTPAREAAKTAYMTALTKKFEAETREEQEPE